MPIEPPFLKHINRFVRRHIFFTAQSFTKYTTSQRRKFERDIYDHARAIALSNAQAKLAVIYARRLCGQEEYDSDSSRLDDDEVHDSELLRTPPETPWYFSLDWSLAATTDAAKPPQTSDSSETSNKRAHDDLRGSCEKRKKFNGVMTSSSQGADSVTKKDEGGHHPTENIAAQETFSEHLARTPSGHNSPMEQLVPTPGLPASTGLVSSIPQVDTSLTTKDKGQNSHEGAEGSKEGLGSSSSSEHERQRNFEKSTSANKNISSKGLERIAKEPFVAARSLDESSSQEQDTLNAVKHISSPQQSGETYHNHQLLSISSLTRLDQQANDFTYSPQNDVHSVNQGLSEEQCGEEHATSIRKMDQIVPDSITLPQDSRVANSSIRLPLLESDGAQLAEGVQSPNVKGSTIGQSVQPHAGYTNKVRENENLYTPFERYNKITDPWHPSADGGVLLSGQHEVHRTCSDSSHHTSRSSLNNERDIRLTHGDHKSGTSIASAENGNGSPDGAQRQVDGNGGRQRRNSGANTSHGYSVPKAAEAFACRRCPAKFVSNTKLHNHIRDRHAKKPKPAISEAPTSDSTPASCR